MGQLTHFSLPRDSIRQPIRVETGVERGGEVSAFYDPMIAKLIVHRPSREKALEDLATRCEHVLSWPVRTNAAFLANLLRDADVVAGAMTTGLIASKADVVVPAVDPSAAMLASAARVLLLGGRMPNPESAIADEVAALGPWEAPSGLRLNASSRAVVVALTDGAAVYDATPESADLWARNWAEQVPEGVLVRAGGDTRVFRLARHDGTTAGTAGDGAVLSPMPGRVIAVDVAAGDAVAKGQRLLVLEAMKMEHALVAPFNGTVAAVNAAAGGQVSEGAVLVRVDAGDPISSPRP